MNETQERPERDMRETIERHERSMKEAWEIHESDIRETCKSMIPTCCKSEASNISLDI